MEKLTGFSMQIYISHMQEKSRHIKKLHKKSSGKETEDTKDKPSQKTVTLNENEFKTPIMKNDIKGIVITPETTSKFQKEIS